MDNVYQFLLLIGPPLVVLLFIAFWRKISWFKTACLAAIFVGGTIAYTHFQSAGIYGLILALAGVVVYVEELRVEMYREIERLAHEESWEYVAPEEPTEPE
ncbi:MAG: hypothetical protein ACLFUS_08980 [Candidatus Sumerlaeia bacterium]